MALQATAGHCKLQLTCTLVHLGGGPRVLLPGAFCSMSFYPAQYFSGLL